MNKTVKTVATTLTGGIIGGIIGAGAVGRMSVEKISKVEKMSDKHLALFQMMNQWVRVKQEGKNLSAYFEKNGYKKIAIYGISYAGETLVEELRETDIEVLYGIDQKAQELDVDINVVTLDDELEEVDVIVVTAITFFDEIEEKLSEIVNYPIVSLEDILYEV